jgi:hypothetical protein
MSGRAQPSARVANETSVPAKPLLTAPGNASAAAGLDVKGGVVTSDTIVQRARCRAFRGVDDLVSHAGRRTPAAIVTGRGGDPAASLLR